MMNHPVAPDSEISEVVSSADSDAGVVFDWCLTTASVEIQPSVLKAQFGDGYAQRRPSGINAQSETWRVEMRNVGQEVYLAVLGFVAARNGVDVFNWTPPRTDAPRNVICSSWSGSYGDLIADGSRLYSISMTFEQVFV